MNTLAAFPIAVRVSFDTFTPSGSCRNDFIKTITMQVEYCLSVYLWVLHATLTASLIILVTTEAGRLRSSGFSAITVERGVQTQLQVDATT